MSARSRTLALLFAIFAVAQLDRQILSISLEAIGTEFALTDTQLGLLSGIVFALVYVLFGFPIAKLAARGNRLTIVSVSAFVWSLLTVATAAAQNFTHLILARLGVGIGEAGAVAPSHSLISDLYPEDRRTSAMATFASGANLGVLLAFLVGGIIGQLYGWRWAFVAAGAPGLVLAFLLKMLGTEPAQKTLPAGEMPDGSLIASTISRIRSDRGLFHAFAGLTITGIVTFGALAWIPTFLIRAHGLTPAQTGIFLALSVGIGGGIGTFLSGRLADRLGRRHPHWRLTMVAAAIIIAKPFAIGFLLMPAAAAAMALFVVSSFLSVVFWGPTFAYVHGRVPNHMRPMATAVFLFGFNLVGVGIGPTAVGLVSDLASFDVPGRSLAVALTGIQLLGIWGAIHYALVAREISRLK